MKMLIILCIIMGASCYSYNNGNQVHSLKEIFLDLDSQDNQFVFTPSFYKTMLQHSPHLHLQNHVTDNHPESTTHPTVESHSSSCKPPTSTSHFLSHHENVVKNQLHEALMANDHKKHLIYRGQPFHGYTMHSMDSHNALSSQYHPMASDNPIPMKQVTSGNYGYPLVVGEQLIGDGHAMVGHFTAGGHPVKGGQQFMVDLPQAMTGEQHSMAGGHSLASAHPIEGGHNPMGGGRPMVDGHFVAGSVPMANSFISMTGGFLMSDVHNHKGGGHPFINGNSLAVINNHQMTGGHKQMNQPHTMQNPTHAATSHKPPRNDTCGPPPTTTLPTVKRWLRKNVSVFEETVYLFAGLYAASILAYFSGVDVSIVRPVIWRRSTSQTQTVLQVQLLVSGLKAGGKSPANGCVQQAACQLPYAANFLAKALWFAAQMVDNDPKPM